MLATLFCDASWYHCNRSGGWGVWVRSEEGRIVHSGEVPSYVTNSNEAELAAIFAGVHLTTMRMPRVQSILVRSDSLAALDLMSGRVEPRAEYPAAIRLVDRLADYKLLVRLIPKWVMGHQSGDTAAAWINRRVDRLAKEEAKKAYTKKQQELFPRPGDPGYHSVPGASAP